MTKEFNTTTEISNEAANIVADIVDNGRVSTQEELIGEFEFEAGESGWSDEDIQIAINSEWFPTIK